MADQETPEEGAFRLAARKRIAGILAEQWIGRYRVDFLVPDAAVVVEVDGPIHDQPEKSLSDRKRDRYLQREGYTVVRFKNKEVTEDVDRCVDEVVQLLEVRSPRAPSVSVMYVDFLALKNEAEWLLKNHGRSSTKKIKLSRVLSQAAEFMRLNGEVDVHIFSIHGQFVDAGRIDMDVVKLVPFSTGRLIVREHQVEWLVHSLSEHLRGVASQYSAVTLLADDPLYEFELHPVKDRLSVVLRRTHDSNMGWFTSGPNGKISYPLALAAGITP